MPNRMVVMLYGYVYYRRKMEIEAKAKVVASVWRADFV